MPQQPEQSVVTRAIAGDRLAFRQLVEQYQGYLYAVAYRYLNDESEAEDAVQETFVKLWKNFSKYRFEVKLTTWLYKIMVNHCLDVKKRKVSFFQKNKTALDEAFSASTSVTPQTEMEGQELMSLIQQASEQLGDKQKMIFVLRDLEGLDVEEVCDLMGLDQDQVKSNLYHARKRVQTWLQQYYGRHEYK
jgi:RNA polymerase sigma-70 factor, ECF subfamily